MEGRCWLLNKMDRLIVDLQVLLQAPSAPTQQPSF